MLATICSTPHISALSEVMSLMDMNDVKNTTQDKFTEISSLPMLNVAVAVKQGNILATAFHPELTNDLRWHRYVITIFIA